MSIKAQLIAIVLSTMTQLSPAPLVDREQAYCLAKNIYHEARSEPIEDQIMVATVTLNMAAKMGRSVCQEVYWPKRYSWTHAPADYRVVREPEAWSKAVEIAVLKLSGDSLGDTSLADHFYEYKKVRPHWARSMETVRKGDWLVFSV